MWFIMAASMKLYPDETRRPARMCGAPDVQIGICRASVEFGVWSVELRCRLAPTIQQRRAQATRPTKPSAEFLRSQAKKQNPICFCRGFAAAKTP